MELKWTPWCLNGEKSWALHGLEITKTKYGEYRLFDMRELATIGIYPTLAAAQAAGERRLHIVKVLYFEEGTGEQMHFYGHLALDLFPTPDGDCQVVVTEFKGLRYIVHRHADKDTYILGCVLTS